VQPARRHGAGAAQSRPKPPGARQSSDGPPHANPEDMNDLLFVAITTAFFACAWAYAQACDRLG
jgi:hypothetical protein